MINVFIAPFLPFRLLPESLENWGFFNPKMKILLLNTSEGLKPMYDKDYENKKKLKLGEVYKANITKQRNLALHKKYFALINCTWEYLNEKQVNFFHANQESFRKTVQVAAGYSTPIYSIKRNEWIEEPKSISFDNMDELEFRDLYENVKNVLYSTFLKHVSIDEFERNLINF